MGGDRGRLLEWAQEPSPERGIRFARDDGGWDLWSWACLAALAWRVAGGLAERGLGRGDTVALVSSPTPAFVATLTGALLAGATPAPVAPPLALQDADAYAEHLLILLGTARPALIAADAVLCDRLAPLARRAGVARPVGLDALAVDATPRRRPAPHVGLLQFTSGTSGSARGVRVPLPALEANVAAIRRWLRMTPQDATASWLPVHHDMGLIGCLLTPLATGSDLWLMRPEQFVRAPERYLRCFDAGGAQLSAMPGFALAYLARRVPPEALDGLDLRDWRALIVGAERLDAAAFERFHALLAPAGLRRRALCPAYGLAEATLAVTGVPLTRPWRAVRLPPAPLALGEPVRHGAAPDGQRVVGCGSPLAGVAVAIEDSRGRQLPDGIAGQVVVRGASVAAGYAAPPTTGAESTMLAAGVVRTGDAGFLLDGELFVLGRLGEAAKLRGRLVFAEEIEAALVAEGLPAHRVAALLGAWDGGPVAVVVIERSNAAWSKRAEAVLRRRLSGTTIRVMDVPRGTIRRTSSGKPRRRELWATLVERRLAQRHAEVEAGA